MLFSVVISFRLPQADHICRNVITLLGKTARLAGGRHAAGLYIHDTRRNFTLKETLHHGLLHSFRV